MMQDLPGRDYGSSAMWVAPNIPGMVVTTVLVAELITETLLLPKFAT